MKSILVILLGFLVGQSAQPVNFEQGLWDFSYEITSLEAPQLDKQARQNLRRTIDNAIEALGLPQCSGGPDSNPLQTFQDGILVGFSTMVPGGSCTFARNDVRDGGITTEAVCRGPNSTLETVMTFRGSYTVSSFSADVTTSIRRPGPSQDRPLMRMQARLGARRIGPCPATNV